jgi:hypothetical protein
MSETECTCEESVGECDWCLWRAKQAEYWAKYFGLTPGMTRQERINQLEQFRPLHRMREVES